MNTITYEYVVAGSKKTDQLLSTIYKFNNHFFRSTGIDWAKTMNCGTERHFLMSLDLARSCLLGVKIGPASLNQKCNYGVVLVPGPPWGRLAIPTMQQNQR